MCLFGAIDGITSPSDDTVKLCFVIPMSKCAGHLPRPAPRVESSKVMYFQQLGEVECIRGSIPGEPACAMTHIRGGRLSLHIQVPPKDEEFTIRDLVNAAIKFLPKGSTFVQDRFVRMIPCMLVCTDHIDKVGSNRKSHPEKRGREITFILHLFRNCDTSSYQDHNYSMFLFGVSGADTNPVWGSVLRIMHPFGLLQKHKILAVDPSSSIDNVVSCCFHGISFKQDYRIPV